MKLHSFSSSSTTTASLLLKISLLFFLSSATAQQFHSSSLFVEYPGLSTTCIAALNSTVDCTDSLLSVSVDGISLDDTQLGTLCVPACSTSLASLRSAVETACTASTDVIAIDSISYPVTFIPDQLQFHFNITCRKDSTTGTFCGGLFSSWSTQQSLTSTEECSDCLLGTQQMELSSPFGYNNVYASTFSSATVSCGKTVEYSFTQPTTVGTPTATTTETATPTPCVDTYTIQAGDTCNSVSLAQNVSTFSLTYQNLLQTDCADFPATGGQLCLPELCQVYTIQEGDSCYSIAKSWGSYITVTQIVAWNINLNTMCGNIDQWVGSVICVSPPGDDLAVEPTNTAVNPTEVTTAAPAPTNVGPGTNTYCAKYYQAQAGDTCAEITVMMGVSLADFYFLNPGIDENCYNLLAGFNYCVQAVGSITTYTSYGGATTTADNCFKVDAPASCWVEPTDLPEVSYWESDPLTTESASPAATGTSSDCCIYREYIVVTPTDPEDTAAVAAAATNEALLNTCAAVASFYGITVADLLEWNPALSGGTACTLLEGYRYCVQPTEPSDDSTTTNTWLVTSATATPSGTIQGCLSYGSVYGEDNGYYTCDNFVRDYLITKEQLFAWNPWVLSDCSGLYANLATNAWRDVCVSASATATPTATAAATPSSTVSIPGPTQTGIPSTCNSYTLVESGDSCSSIQTEFTITFAQLYAWNPSIGANCEGLWLSYAYCVGVEGGATTTSTSTTSTSTSTTTTPTPAPTQAGTIESCTEFYTVVSGDSCSSIETTHSISFATFYAWNPAIGSNCENLWLGYGYCVAAPTGTGPSIPGPTQTGIAQNCNAYHLVVSGDSCSSIDLAAGISFAQLYEWNPAIGLNCEGLWLGYAYCIGVSS